MRILQVNEVRAVLTGLEVVLDGVSDRLGYRGHATDAFGAINDEHLR